MGCSGHRRRLSSRLVPVIGGPIWPDWSQLECLAYAQRGESGETGRRRCRHRAAEPTHAEYAVLTVNTSLQSVPTVTWAILGKERNEIASGCREMDMANKVTTIEIHMTDESGVSEAEIETTWRDDVLLTSEHEHASPEMYPRL